MDKVKADKLREVTDGHDGTWIAHPGLLKIAKQARLAIPHQWLVSALASCIRAPQFVVRQGERSAALLQNAPGQQYASLSHRHADAPPCAAGVR